MAARARRVSDALAQLALSAAQASLVHPAQEERYPIDCTYIGNPESMMQTVYKCVFFDARKPTRAELAAAEAEEAAA